MKFKEEYYKEFFGGEDEYYLNIVRSYNNGRKLIFNPYAFFLGLFWMLYRKMYRTIFIWFLIVIVIEIIVGFLYDHYLISDKVYTAYDYGSRFLSGSILGFFGNKFYKKEAERKISKIVANTVSEEEIMTEIGNKGGTTLIPHLIIVIILGLLAYLFHNGYLDSYW